MLLILAFGRCRSSIGRTQSGIKCGWSAAQASMAREMARSSCCAGRADIAHAIFGPFKFQRVELLISAARHRAVNQADLTGAEFLQQLVKQETTAKRDRPAHNRS